jgi:hypothetical protein
MEYHNKKNSEQVPWKNRVSTDCNLIKYFRDKWNNKISTIYVEHRWITEL